MNFFEHVPIVNDQFPMRLHTQFFHFAAEILESFLSRCQGIFIKKKVSNSTDRFKLKGNLAPCIED